MESSREYLEIYIIKDNSVRKMNVTNLYGNNQILIYSTSKIEQELISYISGVSEEFALKMNLMQRYMPLLDNDYSVVWASRSGIDVNANILIGKNVSKITYRNIITRLSEIDALSEDSWLSIYNRSKTQNGMGFEYVNNKQSKKSVSQMMDVLHIFCREKIGELPEYDSSSLDEYRKFDLTRLLKYDKNYSNPMQYRASGVVVITPDKFICQNNNREIHTNQIEDILENLYGENCRESIYSSEANKTNSIFLLMSSEMYFPTIAYFPKKINEFQYESISKLLEQMRQIRDSVDLKKETKIVFESRYGKEAGNELNLEIEEFQKYLKEEHDLIVDDSIVGMPIVSRNHKTNIITEEQMKEFFAPTRRISSNVTNTTEMVGKIGVIAISNMKNCFNVREKESGR